MLTIFQTLFSPPRHLILPLVAAWLGSWLSERRLRREDPLRNALSNLVFYGLVAFILGGRIFYAAAHLSAFISSPLSLLSPNSDLFEPLGGIVSTLLVAWVYGQRQKLQFWTTLDTLTPFLAALAVGLGLAHLAAGTAFGRPASVPWAIEMWNQQRHPSQIYETLAALAILGLVLLHRPAHPAGLHFLIFICLILGAHLFLEAYRGDSTLLTGGFRQAQVFDWVLLALSFVAIEFRKASTPGLAPPHSRD